MENQSLVSTNTKLELLPQHFQITRNDTHEVVFYDRSLPKLYTIEPVKMLTAIAGFIVVLFRDMNLPLPDDHFIASVARDIFESRKDWNIKELQLFFKEAGEGKLTNKIFGRIGRDTINEMVTNFEERRCDLREATKITPDNSEPRTGEIDMKKAYRLAAEEGKRNLEKMNGMKVRDSNRRAASDAYAKEFHAWCDENGKFIDDENSVVEFAKIKTFNQDYIDAFIKINSL